MMVEIIKIVLVPIGAALLHDYLKTATPGTRRGIYTAATCCVAWLAFLATGGWATLAARLSGDGLVAVELFSFLLGAIAFGVIYHLVASRQPVLDRLMPLASMAGIVYFTTVTTAAGRDNLLQIGGLLFLAAALHNLAGFSLATG